MTVPEVRALRWVFAGMALLTALVTVYAWTQQSTATDWTWFYRLALPISVGVFAWRAWRPHVVGASAAFVPVGVVALVRLVDFGQDWWLTPEAEGERVDLASRALLGSYGWGMIVLAACVVHLLERLLSARWGDERGHLCLNAPGCPSWRDPSPSLSASSRHR